jgi:hypothetical protein
MHATSKECQVGLERMNFSPNLQSSETLAKDRGVTDIAKWFNHEQITIDDDPDTIAHLRRDMKFGTPRKLPIKASWVDSAISGSMEI